MNLREPLRFLKSKFVKDAATLQASAMMNQASQLVSSIAVAYLLGSHGQGLFLVAVSLQALLFNLVNVGIVLATTTQVAAASARDIRVKVAGWLAFLVKSHVLCSSVQVVVGWFALPWIADWMYRGEIGADGAREVARWAWWLTLWPLLDTPRTVAQVALHGTRRMLRLGQLDNGTELVRMFLVTSGAAITGSPQGAVLGEIASRVLGAFLAAELYHSARTEPGAWLPSLRDVFRGVPDIPLRQGIPLGLRVGVIKNSHVLFVEILPDLVLPRVAGFSWVAYFNLAGKIVGLPLMLQQGVARTGLAALSQLRGLHDLEGFKRLYLRSTLITGAVIGGGTLLLLPLISPVVGAVWPADFQDPVFHYAWILALGLVPLSFAVALDPFYILTNNLRACLLINAIGAAITIPTNGLLIWLLPETGVAWGLTLYRAWLLFHFAFVAWYFRSKAAQGEWRAPEPASTEAPSG